MIDPIGSSFSSLPSSGAASPPSHPAPERRTEAPKPPAVEAPAVNIELSDSTQAMILRGQGQTIAEIALQLRLDEVTVRSYFNFIGQVSS